MYVFDYMRFLFPLMIFPFNVVISIHILFTCNECFSLIPGSPLKDKFNIFLKL